MTVTLIVQLIEQGIVLLPQFVSLWNSVKDSFSSDDQATIDAALAAALAKDAADTAQADIDLKVAGATN